MRPTAVILLKSESKMSEKKIAVVGAFGYGKGLIEEVLKNGRENNSRLVAVVDVSPKMKDERAFYDSKGVGVYKSLEEMYSKTHVDLVAVASPIQYHSVHACTAMENGSHVLLEKPVAGCMDDAREIEHISRITGKKVLVGYQLIYDETIRKVKEIILSGYLGGLLDMKCIVLWPRSKAYFKRNSWAGKISDKLGRYVRDSVANNATAHHYMTLLYFAGCDMQSAGEIENIEAKLYRTNDIETFDTCAAKITLEGGIGMLAISSHATKSLLEPKYMLWFEKGYIECENDMWKINKDGQEEIIGASEHNSFQKVWDMVRFIDDDDYLVKCTLECASKHTRMIEKISEIPVIDLQDDVKETDDGHLYIGGLDEKLNLAYEDFSLLNI